MTALLDHAFARVRSLPSDEQDALAVLLLTAYNEGAIPPLDEEARAAIREGLAQAECGEYANNDEIDILLRTPRRRRPVTPAKRKMTSS